MGADVRLFVAVLPPPAVRDELRRAVAPLRTAHPNLSWVDPADWHVTLAFLGAVPDNRVAGLTARCAAVAGRSGPFALRLAGAGCFGSRVLWAGVAGDLANLHRLADAVRAGVDDTGLPRDERPLRAHLTLVHGGRSRRRGGDRSEPLRRQRPDVTSLRDALAGFRGARWPVDDLWLLSVRPAQAPRYAPVTGWPLTGADRPGPD